MAKKETQKEVKQRVTQKVFCAASCAGCQWHDMAMVDHVSTPTLFNHFCFNPLYAAEGARATYENTTRIAPPQPEWCKERRPQFTI